MGFNIGAGDGTSSGLGLKLAASDERGDPLPDYQHPPTPSEFSVFTWRNIIVYWER